MLGRKNVGSCLLESARERSDLEARSPLRSQCTILRECKYESASRILTVYKAASSSVSSPNDLSVLSSEPFSTNLRLVRQRDVSRGEESRVLEDDVHVMLGAHKAQVLDDTRMRDTLERLDLL